MGSEVSRSTPPYDVQQHIRLMTYGCYSVLRLPAFPGYERHRLLEARGSLQPTCAPSQAPANAAEQRAELLGALMRALNAQVTEAIQFLMGPGGPHEELTTEECSVELTLLRDTGNTQEALEAHFALDVDASSSLLTHLRAAFYRPAQGRRDIRLDTATLQEVRRLYETLTEHCDLRRHTWPHNDAGNGLLVLDDQPLDGAPPVRVPVTWCLLRYEGRRLPANPVG